MPEIVHKRNHINNIQNGIIMTSHQC